MKLFAFPKTWNYSTPRRPSSPLSTATSDRRFLGCSPERAMLLTTENTAKHKSICTVRAPCTLSLNNTPFRHNPTIKRLMQHKRACFSTPSRDNCVLNSQRCKVIAEEAFWQTKWGWEKLSWSSLCCIAINSIQDFISLETKRNHYYRTQKTMKYKLLKLNNYNSKKMFKKRI